MRKQRTDGLKLRGYLEYVLRDARTGEDITRSVLAQIIFEEENKGQHLLPIQFLRQLIRFYGDSLQAFVPGYLEMSMDSFAKNQEQMRDQFAQAFGNAPGFKEMEKMGRQNLAMFERAMQMLKSKLYQREMEKRNAERDKIEAGKMKIDFGSQIRNYVLHPYKLVKDARTGVERSDAQNVLDGELDDFIKAFLLGSQAKV